MILIKNWQTIVERMKNPLEISVMSLEDIQHYISVIIPGLYVHFIDAIYYKLGYSYILFLYSCTLFYFSYAIRYQL